MNLVERPAVSRLHDEKSKKIRRSRDTRQINNVFNVGLREIIID